MPAPLTKLLLFAIALLLMAAMPWEPDSPEAERPCSSLALYGNSTPSYWKYEYDENRRLVRIQRFKGKNERGAIERNVRVSWDATGRIETRLEIGRSGEPNGRGRIIIRDESDRLVEQYSLWKGQISGRESWTYNDAGLLVQHRKREIGGDRDGWDYGSDFEYDARGRVTVEYYGFFPDGFPLRQWRVSYARNGRRAEVVRSRFSDDRVHSRRQLFFDAVGRLIREETPATIVGDRLSITLWTYDNAGRLLQIDRLNERNLSRERVAYHYDNEGRLWQKLIFYEGSREPSVSVTWDYNCWIS